MGGLTDFPLIENMLKNTYFTSFTLFTTASKAFG